MVKDLFSNGTPFFVLIKRCTLPVLIAIDILRGIQYESYSKGYCDTRF